MRVAKSPYCGAINCTNNKGCNPDMRFFSFPKDPERCRRWVVNSRREDLHGKDAVYLHKNVKLCPIHFEDSQFMNKQKKSLIWNAVPTIFNIPNPPKAVTIKRKIVERNHLPYKKIKMNNKTSSCLPVTYSEVATYCEEAETNIPSGTEIVANTEDNSYLKKVLKLKVNELNRIRLKYRNLKLSVSAYKAKHKQTTKNTDVETVKSIAAKYLDDKALNFFISQIKNSHKNECGFRWTSEDKLFALTLLYCSSKCYKFLAEHFSLPSIRTLQKYSEGISFKAGFNNALFLFLKQKAQQFNKSERLINLCMDDMSIMANLKYEIATDKIVGFEDFGNNDTTTALANSVMVVMISGVVCTFKQPIAFFFSNESINAKKIKEIFYTCVEKLSEVGLVVKNCITDQGANYMQFRQYLNVSHERPYVNVNGNTIYFFYDSPHLLKSVRNNLHRYNIQHKLENNEVMTAKWDHIVKLFNNDSGRKYKYVPKLTKKCVELPPFSKMKVSTAVHTLSHSTAAGIETYITQNLLPSESIATADFCEQMNKLFDIFNSSSLSGPIKARTAMTKTSEHFKWLKQLYIWVQSWVFIDSKTANDCSNRIKCKDGWLSNITALTNLWVELEEVYDTRYLFTRKIAQDCLENFFAVIRQKGGNCSNPTAKMFINAFNHSSMNNLLTPLGNTNCENIDWSQLFLEAKSFNEFEKKKNSISISLLNNFDSFFINDSVLQDVKLDETFLPEKIGMTYVCGYIVSSVLKKHDCNICRSKLLSDDFDLSDCSQLLCYFKSYENNENPFSALHICSNDIFNFLLKCEEHLMNNLPITVHKSNVGSNLINNLINLDGFPDCCPETRESFIKYFVKLRLFYIVKFANRDILQCKRKERKLLILKNLGC